MNMLRVVGSGVAVFLGASAAYAQPREDLGRKGLVSSHPCPFSCRTQGIPKKECRDWKEGNTCFIEDLRSPPAPGQAAAPQTSDRQMARQPDDRGHEECRQARGVAEPRIEIARVKKTGNYFDNKIKIVGTVEGSCLTEAGVFEEGQKVATIPIVTTPDFRRFEFEVTSRGDREPEVRAYNITGERDIESLSERARMDDRGFDEEYERERRGRPRFGAPEW